MQSRVKVRKSAAPVLDPALAFDGVGARALPPVLTAAAVAKGLMPPLGVSALPPSLEAAIPADLRFWTAKSAEEAKAVRDELVERSVVRPADVLKVDGELRRVTWQAFLVEEDAAPETAVLDEALVAGLVKDYGPHACVTLSDTPAHRLAISKMVTTFALETRPGVIYGATVPLSPEASHVIPLATTAKSHAVKLIRKDAAEPPAEERFVFGVVLEPDVVDTQKDTYSAAEVRKAAHRFMEAHAQLGKQHAEIVTGKLKILESYVAPVDFAVGSEVVKAGTWMLAIRVVDDELWTAVKSGSFTGFSIGGTAIRQPDQTPAPAA